ncbi:MAG TPA: DNA polymerase III subunit beta [Candidatus Paceibacterota bacterium]|nr:DNA polymerase III subunit beta [Candidatus Paceibacterota bacterium]
MDVVIHRENLQRALLSTEKIAAKNATLPILGNILMRAAGGQLHLSATNLEVGITVAVGAKVTKEGSVAVPARLLTDLVRASRSDAVTLRVAANVLSASAGSSKTTILCFDPAEYPIIPSITSGVEYVFPIEQLHTLCVSAMDSIATSESRPELAGALLSFNKQGITIAATDSFRLVEHVIPEPQKGDRVVIIPRTTIMELIRVFGGVRGEVTARIADNQILFTHEGLDVISRLIDGKFPDYQKVVPDRSLAKVLVRREDFANAIHIASLFSSSISDVKLACTEKELTVSGKHSAKGEGVADLEANLKGDAFDISLNYHYLLDGLKIIPTEKVILEFTGKGSPFVLRPDDGLKLVYIVMPLRG